VRGDRAMFSPYHVSAKLFTLLLLDPLDPRARWPGGEFGGSLYSFEGWRFGVVTKGSSPGIVSSVNPDLAFGATARTALCGVRGRSKLCLWIKDLGEFGEVSREGRM
jgi:hypothetical protein